MVELRVVLAEQGREYPSEVTLFGFVGCAQFLERIFQTLRSWIISRNRSVVILLKLMIGFLGDYSTYRVV